MNWLRTWFGTPSTSRPSARRREMHLTLQVLEDRTVPTVVFQPNFSGTTVTSDSSAYQYSLSGEQVSLIFAGSYWQTTQGKADQKTLTSDVTTLLGSPYLTGLAQYEPDGLITLPSLYTAIYDPNAIAIDKRSGTANYNYPTNGGVNNYFGNQLTKYPSLVPPGSPSGQQQPLYVVFNDPAHSGDGQADYGENWYDANNNHCIYVATLAGAHGGVNINQATETFGHELAEATASSVVVNDPGNLKAGSQICDNEGENGIGYEAPVDGIMVQAYWSQKDGAWIVPDGSSTTTSLRPIWSHKQFTSATQDLSNPTAPTAGTGTTIVGRQNTYVITTGGALWEHTGSDFTTGWTELAAFGVTNVSIGEDSSGNDVQFVQFDSGLSQHTGSSTTSGWSYLCATDVGSISASQLQADTVFTTYNGDLWECVNTDWTQLETSGVSGISAGKNSSGQMVLFATFGGALEEQTSTGWAIIAHHVKAFSASQVQANTVCFSTGGNLMEHVGGFGNWTIKSSGVSMFSAGVGAQGKAVVFAEVNGDLREFFGTNGHVSSAEAQHSGVTSFSASQDAADTAFLDLGSGLWEYSGAGSNLTKTQVL
jgi:hypothetical protein